MASLVVVGGCNMDLIAHAPRLPAAGETVLGDRFATAPGGKGSNQAVAAARLGARVSFVGRVGTDDFGVRLRQMLDQESIEVRHLAVDQQAPSGVALITVDERGENCIVVASGANANLDEADVDAAADTIRAARVLLLQLESPIPALVRASEIAARAGTRVVFSVGPARDVPEELLRRTSVLIANRREVCQMAGMEARDLADVETAARQLLARGVGAVAATLGAKGALAVDASGARLVLGFPVKAIDTVGAGDAFSAGLSVALANGEPLDVAVRVGNACGALASTRPGAQPAMPGRAEVDRLLGMGHPDSGAD